MLICDDESHFAVKFRIVLQRLGLETSGFSHVKTGEGAVEAYGETPTPQFVFLDINIRGSLEDGFQTLKALRGFKGNAVIGIISTSADKSDVEKARSLGADFYIVKAGGLEPFVKRMGKFKRDFIDGGPAGFKVYNS